MWIDGRRSWRGIALLYLAGLGFTVGVAQAFVIVDFSQPAAAPAPAERPLQPAALREALSTHGLQRPVELGAVALRPGARAARRIVRLVGDRDGASGAQPWRGLYLWIDGERGVRRSWVLPADAGNAVHGALDLDGDGAEELLLRRDSARMGVQRSDLVVWSLRGESPRRLAEEPQVVLDTCDAAGIERVRQSKQLTFIADGAAGALRIETTVLRADCPAGP